jgi:predicted nucleotidyltransferase
MDFAEFQKIAVQLRRRILDAGVKVDGIFLFGAHARGDARLGSDIDIAVLSRSFGRNRFKEGCFVNLHAGRVHPDIEAIPVAVHEWLDRKSISPILHEIKKHGICLL